MCVVVVVVGAESIHIFIILLGLVIWSRASGLRVWSAFLCFFFLSLSLSLFAVCPSLSFPFPANRRLISFSWPARARASSRRRYIGPNEAQIWNLYLLIVSLGRLESLGQLHEERQDVMARRRLICISHKQVEFWPRRWRMRRFK